MGPTLSAAELRVLGSLVEKHYTTPAYYPLTLNSLQSACNQKSNREPVTEYSEVEIEAALEGLRAKGYAAQVKRADSRTMKFEHLMEARLDLGRAEVAVLAELMLRGPQTPGELRSRASRMQELKGMDEVMAVLDTLMGLAEPLVAKLPRQAGSREHRYAQLLGGAPSLEEGAADTKGAGGVTFISPDSARIEALEARIAALETEVAELKGRHLGGSVNDTTSD